MGFSWFALVLAMIFGSFAAMMAYFITYEEYRHHFSTPNRAQKIAFQAACLVFVVFTGIGCLLALFLPCLINT